MVQMSVEKGAVRQFLRHLKDLCASVFGWDRHMLEGDTVTSRDFRETADIYWTRKLGIDNFTPKFSITTISMR